MSILIRDISKRIKGELRWAEMDIRKALEYKSEYPRLADKYYAFAMTHMNNVDSLHDEVKIQISEHRKTKGEPPEVMLVLWDFEHEDLIEYSMKIKHLEDMYKKM